jgi:hypothetical protein
MSDSNLVDKLSEAVAKAIKKANIFEKATEIKSMLSGFIILTTIMGTTIIINQVYKRKSITFLEEKIEKLVETNTKLYEIIQENNKLYNKFIENQLLHTNNTEIEKESEDNELLDECYDVLPCNNSKKVTGLNKIFNWN